MSLLDQVDAAELVVADQEYRVAFVWYGGQTVHVFNEEGEELHAFTMGGARTPSKRAVHAAIRRQIEELQEEENDR